jgi:hypothetical protein
MAPLWESLIPNDSKDNVTFTFDPEDRQYDFLVVYEDLPPRIGERQILRSETLACPKRNTLLITPEPSSIRIDGLNYLAQFGGIWTSRFFDSNAKSQLEARGCKIHDLSSSHPPPLRWFYGRDMENTNHLSFEQIANETPIKTRDLSTVTSNKAMKHTVHAKRLEFVSALKARLSDNLSLYGRGFHEVRDKREAMSKYRYHIAIENHVQSGHITEKLTDCFLALSLPFYFGAPDYDTFYPRDAVIPIDIFDIDKSEKIIREAIATNQYEIRLPELSKAKTIAMSDSNPLIRAQHWVQKFDLNNESNCIVSSRDTAIIHGRHAFRRAHPIQAIEDAIYRSRMKRHTSSAATQY